MGFPEIIKTLEKSIASIDLQAFDRLVNDCVVALEKGNRVVTSGLGKNVPVCEKFVGTMISLGQDACFMNTNSAVHGDLGVARPGDIVIVLTKSGETAESIYLVDLLKKRNVDIWLLTFCQSSTLIQRVPNHIALHLDHEGDQWNIIPNNSTVMNLIVLQELAMEITKRRGVTLQAFKKNHPGGYIGVQLNDVNK